MDDSPLLFLAEALLAERHDRLADALATGRALLAEPLASNDVADCLGHVMRIALLCNDHATALHVAEVAKRQARTRANAHALAADLRCRGVLEADPRALVLAAQAYTQAQRPYQWACTMEDLAVCLAGSGEIGKAREAFTGAVQCYLDLGAVADLRRAEHRLRPLGIRRGQRGPRRRPAFGWAALTSTELAVAELVAAGLANSAIAARLYMSRSNVQTHVSHILAKLNAHSRVDIARQAAERGGPPNLASLVDVDGRTSPMSPGLAVTTPVRPARVDPRV
jgi:DNA-binding CsgD family transcriptional regulator